MALTFESENKSYGVIIKMKSLFQNFHILLKQFWNLKMEIVLNLECGLFWEWKS